jgi:single-strand DNA-binding protein
MNMPQIAVTAGVAFDPELQFSQAGKPWAKLRLVVKDRKRDDNGQWVDGEPWWLDAVVFGPSAENVAESVVRGDTVIVRLEMNRWKDKNDGSDREVLRMKVDEIGLSLRWASYRKDGADSPSHSPSRQTSPAAPPQEDEPPF